MARAGLLLAVAPLLATHHTIKAQGGNAPVIPLPTSSPQLELGFELFFPLALKEIECDPFLFEQVRLCGCVCFEKKH